MLFSSSCLLGSILAGASLVFAGSENAVVTLRAKAVINPKELFIIPGNAAIQSFINDFGFTADFIEKYRQEAIEFFNQEKFDIGLKLDSIQSDPLNKTYVNVGGDQKWLFAPFVFRRDLNYHISSHSVNPNCVGSNVTVAGFTASRVVPAEFTVGKFGTVPAGSSILLGKILYHGTDNSAADGKKCDRVIVDVKNKHPSIKTSLNVFIEQNDIIHPEFGSGTTHTLSSKNPETGEVEIWTYHQF